MASTQFSIQTEPPCGNIQEFAFTVKGKKIKYINENEMHPQALDTLDTFAKVVFKFYQPTLQNN